MDRDVLELEIASRDAEIAMLRDQLRRQARDTSDYTLEALELALGQQKKQHAEEMERLQRMLARAEASEGKALQREQHATQRRDSLWRELANRVDAEDVRAVESADKKRAQYVTVLVAVLGALSTLLAGLVASSWQ